jgi:hypothetical protein
VKVYASQARKLRRMGSWENAKKTSLHCCNWIQWLPDGLLCVPKFKVLKALEYKILVHLMAFWYVHGHWYILWPFG